MAIGGPAVILQAQNLTVAIGGKVICRDLNMVINAGECWAVLGQNGAGKTTLLRTLAGLHAPQAGTVSCNGTALQAHSRRVLAQHMALLMQNDGGEFWGTVLEYVLLGRFPYRSTLFGYSAQDQAIALQVLASMELAPLAQRPLHALSGGERQRAAIAQVLAQQAQCYLLDEPLQHLDVRHQIQAMQLFGHLRQQHHALLMALHDMHWAQRCCDHALLLFADGNVLHGSAAELLTHSHLEALYQCSLREGVVEGERCYVPGV